MGFNRLNLAMRTARGDDNDDEDDTSDTGGLMTSFSSSSVLDVQRFMVWDLRYRRASTA